MTGSKTATLCGAPLILCGEETNKSALHFAATTKAPERSDDPGKRLAYLHTLAQAAIEVEHSTIPPYLTAMYTLKPGSNSRAYEVIRSVVMEEMLHMTLAANLLTAIGGTPRTTYEDFCTYPTCVPCRAPAMWVPLRHFSPEAIDAFLTIESPAASPGTTEHYDKCKAWHFPESWGSIGDFYALIERHLIELVDDQGEAWVFGWKNGKPDPERTARQCQPYHYYNGGGNLTTIHDKDTALAAMNCIVEQGEGLSHELFHDSDKTFERLVDVPHYYRFNEIRNGRYYRPSDRLSDPPQGNPLPVEWSQVYRIEVPPCPDKDDCTATNYPYRQPDPRTQDAIRRFNVLYAALLALLELAFNRDPRKDSRVNRGDLAMERAVHVMLSLKYAAEDIFHVPLPGGGGLHAHPTFTIDHQAFTKAREWVEHGDLKRDPLDVLRRNTTVPN